MVKHLKQFLLGASVFASLSAVASSPAAAIVLKPSNIQFSTYQGKPQIETYSFGAPQYRTINGVERQILNHISRDNVDDAIAALTDDSSATNVEIWYGSESPQRVGFTGNLGNHTVKVETVLLEDWQDEKLAKGWLDGFLQAYGTLLPFQPTAADYGSMLTALQTNGLYSAGDPNVGHLTLDDQTGELTVDLVGHLDRAGLYVDTRPTIVSRGKTIANPNYLKPKNDARYNTGSAVLNQAIASVAAAAVRDGRYFQMSEIARVTFNDQVNYAFAFSAFDSGAFAGNASVSDTTSHTAVYRWTHKVDLPKEPEPVPEPSTLFGLVTLGGLIAAKRKSKVTA